MDECPINGTLKFEFTFSVLLKGGENMRSEWVPKGTIRHVLFALTPENRLACCVSIVTGLRINDVLAIPTAKWKRQRFTVREQKTGKTKFVRIPNDLLRDGLAICGENFVFEHRLNGRQHRTRQAVFKDIKRACRLFRIKENVCPHSLRKIYAVDYYERTGDIKKVQKLLNHSSEAVTHLYAMADILDKRGRLLKHVKVDKPSSM